MCVIHTYLLEDEQRPKTRSCRKDLKRHVCFNKPILYEVCIGICMYGYRIETVKTFTAEATSLKFTYILYVFETFLKVVEMITS